MQIRYEHSICTGQLFLQEIWCINVYLKEALNSRILNILLEASKTRL